MNSKNVKKIKLSNNLQDNKNNKIPSDNIFRKKLATKKSNIYILKQNTDRNKTKTKIKTKNFNLAQKIKRSVNPFANFFTHLFTSNEQGNDLIFKTTIKNSEVARTEFLNILKKEFKKCIDSNLDRELKSVQGSKINSNLSGDNVSVDIVVENSVVILSKETLDMEIFKKSLEKTILEIYDETLKNFASQNISNFENQFTEKNENGVLTQLLKPLISKKGISNYNIGQESTVETFCGNFKSSLNINSFIDELSVKIISNFKSETFQTQDLNVNVNAQHDVNYNIHIRNKIDTLIDTLIKIDIIQDLENILNKSDNFKYDFDLKSLQDTKSKNVIEKKEQDENVMTAVFMPIIIFGCVLVSLFFGAKFFIFSKIIKF